MKHFIVILAVTILVWFGVSMSEEADYPMRVRIEMTGFDTVRYAVVRADTAINVNVRCSGFDAFLHSVSRIEPSVKIEMPDTTLYRAVAMENVYGTIRQSIIGSKAVSSNIDSLHLLLAERSHRTFSPQIEGLQITFAEGYGLYGQPEVVPDHITLYGPEEALQQISGLHVKPTEIADVSQTQRHTLELEPVWEKFHDVHPSATSIDVTLPVEAYVERLFEVPVTIEGADTTEHIKVYPDVVKLHVWVARRDMPHITASQFSVGIGYDEVVGSRQSHKLRLMQYPDNTRLRTIEPQEVQCVIIK